MAHVILALNVIGNDDLSAPYPKRTCKRSNYTWLTNQLLTSFMGKPDFKLNSAFKSPAMMCLNNS